MSEHTNTAATALQLTTPATLHRFVRSVSPHSEDKITLHLYEHRNSQYSIHGHLHTSLASRLLPDDLQPPTELPAAAPAPSLETLYFDARTARDVATAALFTSGRKVHVWGVTADGRLVSRMDGSPGNLDSLEEWLGDRAGLADGAVLAVRLTIARSQTLMGICAWDASVSRFSVADVFEDDSFSHLESLLVATNAKEVVFCEADLSTFDMAKLQDVIERCGVAMTLQKNKSFNPNDVPVDLQRLVGSQLTIASFLDKKPAVSAIAAIIDYLRLMQDPNLEGRCSIVELATSTYMHLDNAAMRALNILPFPGDGGKLGSLYGLLNRTKSPMGARLLRRWLSQPLQNIDDINDRLDVVSAFVSSDECRAAIRDDHINKMPDINLLCRRFTKNNGAKASLQDVVRLYQCSIRLPFLCDDMSKEGVDRLLSDRYVASLRKLVSELANFEALVETTIDLDQIDNGEFVVSPAVDPELQTLRVQQDSILADIDREYHTVCKSISGLKGDSLKLERKDNLGYIFRLTRKEEKLIRGKKQFTVLETRKDGVRFQSKGLRRLSESYQGIADEYQDKEREMRLKTLEVAGTYVEVFLDVAGILAEVDILSSFATVAVQSRSCYVRPVMKPSGVGLVLKQARHPIVEENMADGAEFIANDLDLTRESKDEQGDGGGGSLLLVTGPNMGGKSTYIRSAGVLTLMAHVGAYVPASEAIIPLTDRIFARVGAGDNQHRAISTFMSEMLETASILKSASSKSLVIIDELGRGTGTMDGYGLAYAISKHIATKIKSACLFATHFFELTALANDASSVKNVHVSAVTDPRSNKLTFLYDVQHGACDQSFGVHVAEMAHFPLSVVEAAKRKATELEGCGAPSKRLKAAMISEEEKTAGHKLITKFIEEVRSLPVGTNEEMESSVLKARTMRQQVLAEKNEYIAALLAQG